MYAKGMVKQSLPLLILCGLGAIVAGGTLGLMLDLFRRIPGLLIVIPGIIALRGNISTALGSRLGSAYHLGVIDEGNLWNDELKENILGSLVLSFFVSLIIGVFAFLSSFLLNVYLDPVKIIFIAVLAGVISALVQTVMTVGIIFLVFKRGYDPDNITGPALATFGDIITICCIFFVASLVEVIL